MGSCLNRCYPESIYDDTSNNNKNKNYNNKKLRKNETLVGNAQKFQHHHDQQNENKSTYIKNSKKCLYHKIVRGYNHHHHHLSNETRPSNTSLSLCKTTSATEKRQGKRFSYYHPERSLPKPPCDDGDLELSPTHLSAKTKACSNLSKRDREHWVGSYHHQLLVFKVPDSPTFSDISIAEDNIIDDIFENYRDNGMRDVILSGGIEKFCNDLFLRPDDFRILILAWYFGAQTMCKFTRSEFKNGFQKLGVKSIVELQNVLFEGCICKLQFNEDILVHNDENFDGNLNTKDSEMKSHIDVDNDRLYGCIYPNYQPCTCGNSRFITNITGDREKFKDLYRWSYKFSLDLETGQRTLPIELAMSMWQLIFSQNLIFLSAQNKHCNLFAFGEMTDNSKQSFPDLKNTKTCVNYISEISKSFSNNENFPMIEKWFKFLDFANNKWNIRGITQDTWEMLLTFLEVVRDVDKDYDENEAWPSLFDDFVEWLREK